MKESLDKFGEFFVRNTRDKMLGDLDMLLRGAWKAPASQALQAKLAGFTDAQKAVIREVAEHMTTTGMHDLLFALQEEADADGFVRVLVDGTEVTKLSDGMHGEIFTEDGWIARFSKFPPDEEKG